MIMMMMMQGDRHPQAEGAADSGVEQEHRVQLLPRRDYGARFKQETTI